MPRPRIRFATIAVSGLGLFVAVSVGVTLALSGAAGYRSTRTLLAEQSEALVDTIERRIDTLLVPVSEQSDAIERAFARGEVGFGSAGQLDAFMRGALASAPQVSTFNLIEADGRSRRWRRGEPGVEIEDWSGRANIRQMLARGRAGGGAEWLPPLWGPISHTPVLLREMPLRHGGVYIGTLLAVVPVARLSEDLASFARETGVTPFVLYGKDFVLAHPRFAGIEHPAGDATEPLPRIAEIGDRVLEGLDAADARTPLVLRSVSRAKAAAAKVGKEQFVTLQRTIERYGPEPWTIGAYVGLQEGGPVAEMQHLVYALAAGVGVLVVAVFFAAYAGRRLSGPVQALASAARAVEDGELERVPVLPASAIAEFDDANSSFNRMVQDLRQQQVMRRTLGQFVPKEVARRLVKSGGRIEPVETEASVLFCDLEGFTPLTETLGPAGVVEFLNAYFEVMVSVVERQGGIVTQFQGDAILAVFNVPIAHPDHALRAARAAIEMVAEAAAGNFAGRPAANRVGVATGMVIAGAVGSRGRLSYTVHGDAVNLASRLETLNKQYGTRILVSAATAVQCPGLALRRVGDAPVRGLSGTEVLYAPA